MLSDAEQRRLAAIESQLRTDDPNFVQHFATGWKHRPRGKSRGLAAFVALIVAMGTAGVGLGLGSVATVVTALTAIGATAGLWIINRRRPPVLVSAIQIFVVLVVFLSLTYGVQAVAVLTVVAVFVARFFARRYVYAHFKDQNQRQGYQID
jgi:hypothetical protein